MSVGGGDSGGPPYLSLAPPLLIWRREVRLRPATTGRAGEGGVGGGRGRGVDPASAMGVGGGSASGAGGGTWWRQWSPSVWIRRW